ncbi:MAG: site-specific DNA-methyltransferase [Alphaproteobacteria bacterium]
MAEGDSLEWLGVLSDSVVSLVYIDPPFNTGATQRRLSLKVARDADGERVGFGGHRYRATSLAALSYEDRFTDYLAFLEPRLREVWRVLKGDGSVFVHLDAREVHYVKVLMDGLFGRESFINEIIWSYDYGGRPKNRWPAKHDTILWYAKDPKNYTFNYDEIDRIPYMAPSLVGAEKAARGKTPTDVWWHTIVPTNSKEKTGYPTQKPLGILERIVRVHSCAGDLVLDFFAGSGTTGAAASNLKRRAFLVDNNADAIATMKRRFAACHQEMQGL